MEELRYYLDLPQLGGLRRSRQVLRKLLKMSEPMQAEADFSDGWWRGAGEGGPEGVNILSFTGFVFLS